MYSSNPTVTTARLSIGICGALLRGAAEASVSIIRGAGGFSISPTLHCMRVVHYGSETFRLAKLLRKDYGPHPKIENWEDHLSQRLQEIERLFVEKKASPHDVDLEGRTLLHVRSRQRYWQRH